MTSQSAATDDSLVRTIVLIVAIVLLVPFLMMVFAIPMMGMWGGGHMWEWNGAMGTGWSWLLMWLIPLLVLVGAGYVLLRAVSGTDGRETDAALEELRLAYARGDLTDEEFEQRRQRLERER
ncbi:SHOCT domain-containing protein [Natrialbaceae archaeon A-gly3]